MSKQIEALNLALVALEYASTGNRRPELIGPAITALREALAESPAPAKEYTMGRWFNDLENPHANR